MVCFWGSPAEHICLVAANGSIVLNCEDKASKPKLKSQRAVSSNPYLKVTSKPMRTASAEAANGGSALKVIKDKIDDANAFTLVPCVEMATSSRVVCSVAASMVMDFHATLCKEEVRVCKVLLFNFLEFISRPDYRFSGWPGGGQRWVDRSSGARVARVPM